MRPLNRPMFRYGGPIKEGIMKGMKDGGLSNLEGPRRAALVGNPIFPRDESGRSQHFFQFALPFLGAAGRMALRPFGTFVKRKVFGKPTITTGAGGTPETIASKVIGSKNVFKPNVAGRYIMESPEYKFATGAGGKASKFVGGALKGLKKSPLGIGVTAGTLTDILPGGRPFGPDKFLPNILGQRFDEQGNMIPGTGLFNPADGSQAAGSGEMKVVDEIGEGAGTVDPTKLKELNDNRIERTKKRYYELMGLDKMKEGAVYDSLIDASKVVQEEGADLKGAIRSGNLQNRIIESISKNLDKSADLKRQIDAAILKGEITKDIASADTTDKRLKEAKIKQLDRAEKNASVSGQLAAVRAEKGFVPGATTAAILRNEGIKYDTVIQDKLVTDFLEDNPTKTEADYIASLGIQLDDGRYVVGKRLVEKKGNEVAFIV